MKVKELIASLQALDPDLNIRIQVRTEGDSSARPIIPVTASPAVVFVEPPPPATAVIEFRRPQPFVPQSRSSSGRK